MEISKKLFDRHMSGVNDTAQKIKKEREKKRKEKKNGALLCSGYSWFSNPYFHYRALDNCNPWIYAIYSGPHNLL